MKNTVEIDLREIKVKDLYGEVVEISGLNQMIANRIFRAAPTIPVSEAAKKFYYDEVVELTNNEISEIILTIENFFLPIVQFAIMDYLNEKLNTLKQQNENEQKNSN